MLDRQDKKAIIGFVMLFVSFTAPMFAFHFLGTFWGWIVISAVGSAWSSIFILANTEEGGDK
jgi:hypothetical protein